MILPLQVTFRDMAPSQAIEEYVRRRADKLDTFCNAIVRCRVVVEAPHRHSRRGKRYGVRIEMTVPAAELVVNNPDSMAREDVHACIDDAFDDAQRLLHDYARRRRQEVKRSEKREEGRIVNLFPQEGYGFLETRDGQRVYFHRNSVLNHAFDRLIVGAHVRFAAEEGTEGPQASSVEYTR